jgi:hypothetical protein
MGVTNKLTFDPTDSESIAAGSSVGAYVRAGTDGDLIGSETLNSLEWLRVTGPIIDSAGNEVGVTSNSLDVNITAAPGLGSYMEDDPHTSGEDGQFVLSVRVDSLAAVPATALAGTELDYQAFITGPSGELFVGAVDFDIRDLTAASDSVESWTHDGTGTAITSTGTALDVNIASGDIDDSLADTAIKNTQKDVTTTGVILASQLAARKWFYFQNLGNKEVYIGESGVTATGATGGIEVAPNMMLEMRLGPSLSMHAVATSGTMDTRVMELS